jgi:hypothetical protein
MITYILPYSYNNTDTEHRKLGILSNKTISLSDLATKVSPEKTEIIHATLLTEAFEIYHLLMRFYIQGLRYEKYITTRTFGN